MTTESKQEAQQPSTKEQPGDLQASDFFPPGSGWNKSEKPEIVDNGPKPGASAPAPRLSQN